MSRWGFFLSNRNVQFKKYSDAWAQNKLHTYSNAISVSIPIPFECLAWIIRNYWSNNLGRDSQCPKILENTVQPYLETIPQIQRVHYGFKWTRTVVQHPTAGLYLNGWGKIARKREITQTSIKMLKVPKSMAWTLRAYPIPTKKSGMNPPGICHLGNFKILRLRYWNLHKKWSPSLH